jgi:hypothetical protein
MGILRTQRSRLMKSEDGRSSQVYRPPYHGVQGHLEGSEVWAHEERGWYVLTGTSRFCETEGANTVIIMSAKLTDSTGNTAKAHEYLPRVLLLQSQPEVKNRPTQENTLPPPRFVGCEARLRRPSSTSLTPTRLQLLLHTSPVELPYHNKGISPPCSTAWNSTWRLGKESRTRPGGCCS